jgi:N-sulfoglucosamine sulfohydrolase
MKRRDFLKTVGYGTAATLLGGRLVGGASRPTHRAQQRPNILWLISEDTCPDFGCYGNKQVKTPNLDKLASEGALFTNAFTAAPVCSASRSALMTGMYQTSIGAHNHRSHRDDGYTLPKPVQLITEYFRKAGYFTCNCDGLSYKKPGKTDWNFATVKQPFDGTDWSQKQDDQPFFAQVNFSLTHRPFERDKKNPIDSYTVDVPAYYPDHPIARRDWADYLESIQMLDLQIGVALTWLEKEDLADNTIVVYLADNGRPHVRGKQWLYEGGIHVPMMIRWPGQIKDGSVFTGLVSMVDLAPTLLSLIGAPVPSHLQGHIFLGPRRKARKYVFAARDRCDETVDRIRAVRSDRYKYIRNYYPDRPYTQFNAYKKLQYPVLTLLEVLNRRGALTREQALFMATTRPQEELYDLQEDPLELTNLAEDPAHRTILKEHSAKLDEWIEATGDQGKAPENPKVLAYWQQQAAEAFRQTMAQRGLSPEIWDEDYLKWWEKELLS